MFLFSITISCGWCLSRIDIFWFVIISRLERVSKHWITDRCSRFDVTQIVTYFVLWAVKQLRLSYALMIQDFQVKRWKNNTNTNSHLSYWMWRVLCCIVMHTANACNTTCFFFCLPGCTLQWNHKTETLLRLGSAELQLTLINTVYVKQTPSIHKTVLELLLLSEKNTLYLRRHTNINTNILCSQKMHHTHIYIYFFLLQYAYF